MRGLTDNKQRVFFRLALVLLLALPALLYTSGSNTENRQAAPLPPFPHSLSEALEMPAKLDAWIDDHFGYRKYLVGLNNQLHFRVFHDFSNIQMIAGRNGRVFLASHDKSFAPYSAITKVCGPADKPFDKATSYIHQMFGDFRARGFHPFLLIAPSAPVIEYRDLPAWMEQTCSTSDTPVVQALQSSALTADDRQHIFYPLAEMRSIDEHDTLFPKTWFHWAGHGLESVVDLSMKKLTNQAALQPTPLVWQSRTASSDIGSLSPGVMLPSLVSKPDFQASHIDACMGEMCFPALGSVARKIPDMSRYVNPAAPIQRRLLILSDSFGAGVAGIYARYYRVVEHIAGNTLARLDFAENQRLQEVILREPAQTDLLILFHDGGAVYETMQGDLEALQEEGMLPRQTPPAGYATLVDEIYLATLGRRADPSGMINLSKILSDVGAPTDLGAFNALYGRNHFITNIVDDFGKSAEAQKFFTDDTSAFVSASYMRMFDRQPTATGLDFWVTSIKRNKRGLIDAELTMMDAALASKTPQGLIDAETVRRKAGVAGTGRTGSTENATAGGTLH